MLSSCFPDQTVWEYLRAASLPIVLYGTGDGADKIIDVMNRLSIPLTGIFVSDDFYRGQTFRGFKVTTYDYLKDAYSDFIIVVAFGSHLPNLMKRICQLASQHLLVIPDVPVYGSSLFNRDFASCHMAELEAAYALLADDESRQVFWDVLCYKLDGKLPHLITSVSPKNMAFAKLLSLNASEDYLDLGAYRGDTIEEFLSYTNGSYHSITALEPDARSFKKLSEHASTLSNTTLLPFGISSHPEIAYMKTGRGRGSSAGGSHSIQMTSVDTLISTVTPKLSYIKIDVEGSESAALMGASYTLRNQKPKLNVACYHRSEDLFQLPLLIHQLQPDYKIFMRRHPCFPCWDLNLYCY